MWWRIRRSGLRCSTTPRPSDPGAAGSQPRGRAGMTGPPTAPRGPGALAPGTDVFEGNEGEAEQSRSDRVKTEAGALANLRNTTEVGQLSPSDVSNLLQPVDTFMALASSTSETPLDYFDPSAAAASGE